MKKINLIIILSILCISGCSSKEEIITEETEYTIEYIESEETSNTENTEISYTPLTYDYDEAQQLNKAFPDGYDISDYMDSINSQLRELFYRIGIENAKYKIEPAYFNSKYYVTAHVTVSDTDLNIYVDIDLDNHEAAVVFEGSLYGSVYNGLTDISNTSYELEYIEEALFSVGISEVCKIVKEDKDSVTLIGLSTNTKYIFDKNTESIK